MKSNRLQFNCFKTNFLRFFSAHCKYTPSNRFTSCIAYTSGIHVCRIYLHSKVACRAVIARSRFAALSRQRWEFIHIATCAMSWLISSLGNSVLPENLPVIQKLFQCVLNSAACLILGRNSCPYPLYTELFNRENLYISITLWTFSLTVPLAHLTAIAQWLVSN